jgi:hypothetical protein
MDRMRLLPPDPMEAAQVPVEGVDVPETETALQPEGGEPSTRDQSQDQKQFVENEGLANTTRPEVAEDVERPSTDSNEMARAAQRGRTA